MEVMHIEIQTNDFNGVQPMLLGLTSDVSQHQKLALMLSQYSPTWLNSLDISENSIL